MLVKLPISQQLFYRILSHFVELYLLFPLVAKLWLASANMQPKFSLKPNRIFARLFYLYNYIKSIIYARCQKLFVKLTISRQQFCRILSNLCIFYKFICPFLSTSYLNLVGFGLYTTEPKFCLKLHRIFRVY